MARKSPELSDDEHASRVSALVRAARELIEAGAVKPGAAVAIETPYEAMSFVPLIDGAWIDIGIVELAEFTAAVEQHGFVFRRDPTHLLAPLKVFERKGQRLLLVNDAALDGLRDEAAAPWNGSSAEPRK